MIHKLTLRVDIIIPFDIKLSEVKNKLIKFIKSNNWEFNDIDVTEERICNRYR